MHQHDEITRLTLWYWLNGNGQWSTRWHCTNGDSLLYISTILTTAWMFAMYCFYAYRNHQGLSVVKDSHFRSHLSQLRNVFLLCGAIHALNSIGSWFFPMYWLIAALTMVNVHQCIKLLASKKEILAIQRHLEGEQAIQQVTNAMQLIHTANRNNLNDTITQLENALRRSE